MVRKEEKQPENVISAGNVYGSYIHGLFDHAETADVILHALAEKKVFPCRAERWKIIGHLKKNSMINWQIH